jgi:hypothetical protein
MKNLKKIIVISLVCVVVLYLGYGWNIKHDKETAREYFEKRCKEDAGEFIYRTVENVEGLFQMRPRDPRDYFTRLREGDIPEDPYGHTNFEASAVEGLFVYPSKYRNHYQYLETTRPPNAGEFYDRRFPKTKLIEEPVVTGEKYWRYSYFGTAVEGGSLFRAEQTSELQSQYGYTWREAITEQDKKNGVIAGELIVKELATNEVLGIKRGFFYNIGKRMGICPKGKTGTMAVEFISKVLIPALSNELIFELNFINYQPALNFVEARKGNKQPTDFSLLTYPYKNHEKYYMTGKTLYWINNGIKRKIDLSDYAHNPYESQIFEINNNELYIYIVAQENKNRVLIKLNWDIIDAEVYSFVLPGYKKEGGMGKAVVESIKQIDDDYELVFLDSKENFHVHRKYVYTLEVN